MPSAQEIFPAYAQRKSGRLPGFRIVSTTTNPEYAAFLQKKALRLSVPPPATSAIVWFQYEEGGITMHVKLYGHISHGDGWWWAGVGGTRSSDDPDSYQGMLFHICHSMELDPAWQEQEKARARRRVARMLEIGRPSPVLPLKEKARRHQTRIEEIREDYDTSMRVSDARGAASDERDAVRSFLNCIHDLAEEH